MGRHRMRSDQARLLGEDEPAPVRVLRPEGASQFFLTADHADARSRGGSAI